VENEFIGSIVDESIVLAGIILHSIRITPIEKLIDNRIREYIGNKPAKALINTCDCATYLSTVSPLLLGGGLMKLVIRLTNEI